MTEIQPNAKTRSGDRATRARDTKPSILAILHLPPPIHGTTMINKFVAESAALSETFNLRIVPIRFASDVRDSGRFASWKLLLTAKLLVSILHNMIRTRPDLIYYTPALTGWGFYRECLVLGLIKRLGGRIVLHLHGQGVRVAARMGWRRKLYRRFFSKTHVICVSSRLVSDIETVYDGSPHIVPNAWPLAPAPLMAEADASPCSSGAVRFLYLSNITRGKGILELLDAFQLLKESNRVTFQAKIVGQPNDISECELNREIAMRGLDAEVKFTGPLYGTAKQAVYSWADVFVFPTKIDVFGLVILEAMQNGLPVIASRMAAIPDAVEDGRTGYLVEPGDVPGLADKMELLARLPELRKKLGSNGRETYLRKFTTIEFEKNLINVFERILHSGACGTAEFPTAS